MNGKTTILIVIIIVLSVLIVYRYENQEEKPPIAIEGVNTYVDKEVTDRTMASVYFNQFNNMLLNNPSKAYTLIDVTTKTSLNVSNEDEFIEYVNKNQAAIARRNLNNFDVITKNGVKNYYCLANDGVTYVFVPNSVMDYNVRITTKKN